MPNRIVAKASQEQMQEFLNKTKDSIADNGKYYDVLSGKYKNAVKRDMSQRGKMKPLPLIMEKKYEKYLKRLQATIGKQAFNELTTQTNQAIGKGYTKIQKARRLLKNEGAKTAPSTAPEKEGGRGNVVPPTQKEVSSTNMKHVEEESERKVQEAQNEKIVKVHEAKKGKFLKIQEAKVEPLHPVPQTPLALGQDGEGAGSPELEVPPIQPSFVGQPQDQGGIRKGKKSFNEPPVEKQEVELPTDTTELVDVERTREPTMTAPMAEKVSMERHRKHYSPKRLKEEIKAFVQIYDDDIKTTRFKKLAKTDYSKYSISQLRDLHRKLEEEVINYYKSRTGLRLGVVIDPQVLGLNISNLQNLLAPTSQPIGEPVYELFNSKKLVPSAGRDTSKDVVEKPVEVRYALGGMEHALNGSTQETQNLNNTQDLQNEKMLQNAKTKTVFKVPIRQRRHRFYVPPKTSALPVGLSIKS